jgi:hypothetical protein
MLRKKETFLFAAAVSGSNLMKLFLRFVHHLHDVLQTLFCSCLLLSRGKKQRSPLEKIFPLSLLPSSISVLALNGKAALWKFSKVNQQNSVSSESSALI